MNIYHRISALIPLIIITILFFIFGFVTSLNAILIPHLKRACQLDDFISAFVPFAFFSAYFLFSIPSGLLIQKIGYKNGIILGLFICFVGAVLFLPAANTRVYVFFLFALGVLASGITLLQVAANPYVSLLGSPDKASSRISLVGAFNSLGGTLGPIIGGWFILSRVEITELEISLMKESEKLTFLNGEAASVKLPYLVLASCLLFLCVLVKFSKIPDLEIQNETINAPSKTTRKSIFKHRNLTLGIIAIFMYVGAEVSVVDFLIRYAQYLNLKDFTEQKGSFFISGYGLSAMIGRFIGIFLLPYIKPNKAIIYYSLLAILLIVVSIANTSYISLWCIMLVGFSNSVLWPSIFPLAIEGLGVNTKKGSSLLIMAIVGGAIVPLALGFMSDLFGTRIAYTIPILCYIYILYYGMDGYKIKKIINMS
ncbi:MAG: sugar MFS transporter [Cytophagales bacterium]|nr:MAG: sugar MFS transporter [Cytophagales bacterium]